MSSAANARLSACMCTDADWLAVGPSHFPRPAPLAGSVKEGAARDPKYDYGEDEELHVLITGDRQEDVSACWGACCTPCGVSAGLPRGVQRVTEEVCICRRRCCPFIHTDPTLVHTPWPLQVDAAAAMVDRLCRVGPLACWLGCRHLSGWCRIRIGMPPCMCALFAAGGCTPSILFYKSNEPTASCCACCACCAANGRGDERAQKTAAARAGGAQRHSQGRAVLLHLRGSRYCTVLLLVLHCIVLLQCTTAKLLHQLQCSFLRPLCLD